MNKIIKFEDFFKVDKPEKTKVKLNINNGNVNEPSWDLLLDDDIRWDNMNAWKKKQSNNNLNHAEYLLAFAQYYPYGPNYYVFGGYYKVEKILPEIYDNIGYKLTLLDKYSEYRKRLIIKLENPVGRDSYNRWFENIQNSKLNPEIYELSPAKKLDTFPGYQNVLLTHKELQKIINMEAPEWKNALSIVKAVYCITDTSNGQLYIGSASGDGTGLWQRWSSYADVNDLTGGNKTFEELKEKGAGRIIDNFTYSILEIFDMRTQRNDIVKREEFYKRVFKSKIYGMNN